MSSESNHVFAGDRYNILLLLKVLYNAVYSSTDKWYVILMMSNKTEATL